MTQSRNPGPGWGDTGRRAVIDRWLDLQDDESEAPDAEAEQVLYRIADLVDAGVPAAEVADAVSRARLAGWGPAPIAVLLGEPRGPVWRPRSVGEFLARLTGRPSPAGDTP
jgi:hypothetical protein